MRNGDTVRVSSLTALADDPRNSETWTAGKGRVFVVCILGDEPKTLIDKRRKRVGDGIDRFKALRDIGWVPEAEALVNATDEALAAEVARRASVPA